MEKHRGCPHVVEVFQAELDTFTNDTLILRNGWTYQVRGQLHNGIVIERGGEALVGQFDSVAGNARETYLEGVAVGADGLHLDRFTRRLHWGDDRFSGEIERNTEYVGVFDVELVVFV